MLELRAAATELVAGHGWEHATVKENTKGHFPPICSPPRTTQAHWKFISTTGRPRISNDVPLPLNQLKKERFDPQP